MSKKNFLVCLVGLPASGKSTFALAFKAFFEQQFENSKVKIIDPDKIRNTITPDKFDHKKEQIVRNKNLEEIEKALRKGYIAISDDLNYYSSMRHDLKLIADRLHLNFFIIHISTPLETCIEWNSLRGLPIPHSVIKKVNKKLDLFKKYRWDYPIEQINLAEIKDIDEILQNLTIKLLNSNTRNQGKNKWRSSEPSSDNYHQMLDKITRTIAGDILQNQEFNRKKKPILALRKQFIKTHLENSLDETQIAQSFKEYLKKNLHLKIP